MRELFIVTSPFLACRTVAEEASLVPQSHSPASMMAMTGPPPCGPWCMASTDTNTAGSPIAAAATPPTAAFECRWWCTSESSSMIWRRPRSVPRRSASHFMKQLTTRPARSSARGRAGQLQPGIADGVVYAVDVERVAHDRMADPIAAAGPRFVAEQHDLRLRELHARGAGRDRGVELEVSADLLGARHLDLAERDRDPERGRAVGDAHRVVHLAGDVLAARLRIAHGIDGEQRRLGLDVMHVLRIVDAGVAHRGFHRIRDLLDHRRPADVLGKSSALIAVPIARRDFDDGPVLSLLANTVACGVMTPSQPPDQTIGIVAISASLRLPRLPARGEKPGRRGCG